MTIRSILKSKACDGNKNDKKCAKALKKYVKKKYKHHHHHTRAAASARVINKINFNTPAAAAAQAAAAAPTPNPRPTGQGIPADVPYRNIINQRAVYENKLKSAQSENDRLTRLANLTATSTMNDDAATSGTRKAGRPKGSKNKPKETVPMADEIPAGIGGQTFNEGAKDADYLADQASRNPFGSGGLRGFGGGAGDDPPTPEPSTKPPRKKRCPNGERRNTLGVCVKI